MQEPKDYYRILGLSEHASAEEVKQAYRTLARACHPDRNPDDVAAAEQFKGVQEAYEVLSDPQQRQHYDAVRHATASVFGHVRAQAFERSAFYNLDGQPVAGGHGHCYCGPLFDEAVPRPQQDVEVPVRLSFEQALRGGKVEIRLPDGRCARVAVPKGVRSGLKVRLKGKRRPGTEASQGDLYVTFHVAPSARFRR
ncbi:MAG: DnaJ domain-containing protein, partial [Rhodothermales bacterium]|nr:DnaJ domain-containing protein [Rhodothermales bacterium]